MQSARAVRLVALGAATVLLAVGAWFARDGLRQMAFERREAASAAARLAALREVMPEVARREDYQRLALQATEQAGRLGFDPSAWGQRRIHRTTGPATRGEASELLHQVGAGGSERFFAAESFDLAVLSREAGLFTPPAPDDKGFAFAVDGTLHFPLSYKP